MYHAKRVDRALGNCKWLLGLSFEGQDSFTNAHFNSISVINWRHPSSDRQYNYLFFSMRWVSVNSLVPPSLILPMYYTVQFIWLSARQHTKTKQQLVMMKFPFVKNDGAIQQKRLYNTEHHVLEAVNILTGQEAFHTALIFAKAFDLGMLGYIANRVVNSKFTWDLLWPCFSVYCKNISTAIY